MRCTRGWATVDMSGVDIDSELPRTTRECCSGGHVVPASRERPTRAPWTSPPSTVRPTPDGVTYAWYSLTTDDRLVDDLHPSSRCRRPSRRRHRGHPGAGSGRAAARPARQPPTGEADRGPRRGLEVDAVARAHGLTCHDPPLSDDAPNVRTVTVNSPRGGHSDRMVRRWSATPTPTPWPSTSTATCPTAATRSPSGNSRRCS